MKKALLLVPIVTVAMIGFTNAAINAKAAKVFKQTATVYQMKKIGKTYKITSQTKKTTDQDIKVGKSVVIKGQRYYYSHVFKGYITDKAFIVNAKLDAKRANASGSYDNNKKTNTSSNHDLNTSLDSNIKNGYDYNNDVITDYQTYSNVYTNTILNDVNKLRNENGLGTLTLDSSLSNIANQRAKQCYDYRDASWYDGHHDQNGNYYFVNLAQQANLQYSVFGENTESGTISGMDGILEGPTEAANATINTWAQEGTDGPHYKNMMNPSFTKIGIGLYVGPNNGQETHGGGALDFTN